MKVALSLLAFRPGGIGGAETYLRALLRELPGAAAPADRIVAILDRDLAARLATPGVERVVVERSAREIVALRCLEAFTPYRARDLERAFERTGADVALFPQQSIFPRDVRLPAALTIHDVQHLFHPENFSLLERRFRAAIYPQSMERAARLLANSQWTKRTLVERCGVAAERIAVTPLGFTSDAARVEPYRGIPGSYLYYPAATFAHKGHETLLRTYAALRRRGETGHKLVFTGQRTALWRRLSRLAGELGIAGDVIHLGFVPYEDVRRLYAGAAAVVFPTRFEGFGMPVVEAADLGKKVIVSRLAVFDELGVPGEWRIDFADPEQLREALRREGTTTLGRRPCTWAETAAATMQELRAIAP